jgi:uncharacterized cupin superfamily protein
MMSEQQNTQRRMAWTPEVVPPANEYGLEAAPIPSDWILEGEPVTRCRRLWGSTDDMAFTVMWDCTAGRFNWFYDIDETVCILEGSVILTDIHGERRTLQANDTFYFPCGSRYHWTVPSYVRKVAFIHVPLPPKLRYAKRVYRSFKSWIGVGGKQSVSPGGALGGR